jgi:hypothetical protein
VRYKGIRMAERERYLQRRSQRGLKASVSSCKLSFGFNRCRPFPSSTFAFVDMTSFAPVRLWLKEEVDILQHLFQAAAKSVGSQHPNVLAYVGRITWP